MRHLVFILFTLITFAGCSGGSGKKVPAEIQVFNLSSVAGGFAGFGNFRLYAESPSGDIQFSTDISNGVANTELEHGVWNFHVVGWNNDNFMGDTYCGSSTINVPADLQNGKTTIALDELGCNDPFFSPPEFMVDEENDGVMRFQKLKISFCDSKYELQELDNASLTDQERWDQECEVDASSFRIGFIDYEKQPRFGATSWSYGKVQWSQCFVHDLENPLYDLRLPIGNFGNSPIKYVVEGFAAANCDTSSDYVRIPVTRGFLDGANYNFVRAFPGQDEWGDPYRQYISFNVNIAFVEQVGMRMSPTRVSLGDRPVPSVFARTVTLYNESIADLENCKLAPFTSPKFSSPDFEDNCSTITYGSQCQFDIVADLNSVTAGVGIKSPIGVVCDGGNLVQTGEDGFLVCPGGNCSNGDFESDLNIRYVPEHLGNVVVGETPDFSQGGGYELEIKNESDETYYSGCTLNFSGPGVDAFSHAGIINQEDPVGCLSSLSPQADCRVRLAPIPSIVGDQEVSVVLACNEDTSYYLENTTTVTGVHPLAYEGSPLYGSYNGAQDGPTALLLFDNESQSGLNNCVAQISDEVNFEITDKEPNGESISASEFCGSAASPNYVSMDTQCKLGLVPKAGANASLSTDVSIFCDGELAGEVTYKADRVSAGLPNIIVAQEAASFQNVEIPFYGDGKLERKWATFRNNGSESLYGCHVEVYSQSSADAANAVFPSPWWKKCEAELVPGDACEFSFSPSRYPWEGNGALAPGNHNVSYTMVCDDIGSDGSISQVNSSAVNFNITVTDGENSLRLSPSYYNFGTPNDGELVGPTTISLTNISGQTLNGCGSPDFYIQGNESDPNIANFEVTNNNCPSSMAPGDTCTFDLGYRQNGAPSGSVEAEMEIRCDFDMSVRTSSSWIAHFENGGGGSDQLYGKIVYGFANNAEAVTGDDLMMYVYTYSAGEYVSGTYDSMSDPLDAGTANFVFDPTTSTPYRLDFKYTVQAGDSNTSSLALGMSQTALYRNPDSGTNYSYANFNFEDSSYRTAYINETVPPYIVSISSPSANQTYYTGDEIIVDVTYSEPVVVDPPFNTAAESGSIDCNAGTGDAVMGLGAQTYWTGYSVGEEIKIGASIYTITAIQSDTSMTLSPNCPGYGDVAYYRRLSGPEIVLEPGDYGSGGSGHEHIPYVAANDDTTANDNIVRYKWKVASSFYGSGLKIGSDGSLSSGVFSVANPSVQGNNIYYCDDLPDGQCLDQNTDFEFVQKTTISSINSPNGSGQHFAGENITINVNFTHGVQVGTEANLQIRFEDDYGVNSYATLVSSSNDNDSVLTFEWDIPNNFYAADLEVAEIVGLVTEVTAASDGTPVADLVPIGNSDYNSFTYSGTWQIAPGHPKIINITSAAADAPSFTDAGSNVVIEVTFSEDVIVEDVNNLYFTVSREIGGSDANAFSNADTAEATDNDNIVNFVIAVPSSYYVSDAEITSFYGLETQVKSVKSGLYAEYQYPQGAGTPNSLTYNKNLQLGNPPKVTNVTRTDANGNITGAADLDIQVDFNQVVDVVGSPRLVFYQDDGTTPFYANYLSGTGTSSLSFRASITSGDAANTNTQDLAVAHFELNGGTLKAASNQLDFLMTSFPVGSAPGSLSSNENIVIGSNASVTSVTSSGTPSGGTYYQVGDTIDIQVNFSTNVSVNSGLTGSVWLEVQYDNATPYNIQYSSGDGTNQFIFTMTVPSAINTKDLEISAFQGFNLIEASATPISTNIPQGDGSPNSLKSTSNIVIGSPAVFGGIGDYSATAPYEVEENFRVQVTYDQEINIDDLANAANVKLEFLDNDSNPVYAHLDVNALPSTYVYFEMLTPVNMNTTDLAVNAVHGLSHLVAESSGISVESTFPVQGASGSLSEVNDIVMGGPAPTIINFSPNTADGTYFAGSNISMITNFDVPVSVSCEDFNLVKLKLEDDDGDFAYAVINDTCPINNASQIYFDFYVPYDLDFDTDDLKIVAFEGAPGVRNSASGISLDLTGAPYTGASSLQDNAAILVKPTPKITHFEVMSTPLNGSEYIAPTIAGDELIIRVHYSNEVTVAAGDMSTVQLQVSNSESYYVYGDLVGPTDTATTSLDFSFQFPATFEAYDLRVSYVQGEYNIKIAGTSNQANSSSFPQGNQTGALENEYDIVVSNLIQVVNVTSDDDDSATPYEGESLLVKVEFNTNISVPAGNISEPFIRASGDNGSFVEGRIDVTQSYTDTNVLFFKLDFPDEFATDHLRINYVGNFGVIQNAEAVSANIYDMPKNGAPNSLGANKAFVIEEKDPMTHYGSGIDGDINLNSSLTLSARDDIVKDKDNQPKYPVSFFKVQGMQYSTSPEPHHIITIDPDCVNCRGFQQADGTPATVTSIEENDVVMWYVNSEKNNGCGANLAPGMFGFLMAVGIESTNQGRFAPAPGINVSLFGGAYLPSAGIPSIANLSQFSDSPAAGEDIAVHCNIQMARVFMPRVLQIDVGADVIGMYYNEYTGVGGILPIKVKEVLDLMGRTDNNAMFDMRETGFTSTGIAGFAGHSGWASELVPVEETTGGLSETPDMDNIIGGGGAGWRAGGDHEGSTVPTGGASPENLFCAGNCYPGSEYNEMKYAFMGSPGAALSPGDSTGGGVFVLHAKKVENGKLNINVSGGSYDGGGAGAGTIYLDFETINPSGNPSMDVTIQAVANGSIGNSTGSALESGGGGGGHINVRACTNLNSSNAGHVFSVNGGSASGADAGQNGLILDGITIAGECLMSLPE